MSKRFQQESTRQESESIRRPTLPDDVTRDLMHVGARVRRFVSDGHVTQSSQPFLGFKGDTIGPLDTRTIEAQMAAQMGPADARRTQSAVEARWEDKNSLKRKLDDYDDGGDTDVDEDAQMPDEPTSFSDIKAYYVPKNFRPSSSNQGDFEDAQFLQPKESFG